MIKANTIFKNLSYKIKYILSSSAFSTVPADVVIVEVGPRDGLQNEKVLNIDKF